MKTKITLIITVIIAITITPGRRLWVRNIRKCRHSNSTEPEIKQETKPTAVRACVWRNTLDKSPRDFQVTLPKRLSENTKLAFLVRNETKYTFS